MKLLKKLALYVLILLAIIYGYQVMTGKSIATLPQEIIGKLQDSGPTESTNPHYYTAPDKRYPGIDDKE